MPSGKHFFRKKDHRRAPLALVAIGLVLLSAGSPIGVMCLVYAAFIAIEGV